MKFGRSVAPHERSAVAWYQPDVLLTAGRELFSSLDQLRNRDLRETFELPLTVIDRSQPADAGGFWFDFIADTGDGGNATYAVATAALDPTLTCEGGEQLPRGEVLLLGGDLAYPSASSDLYRYRFIEMFEGARRDSGKAQVRGRPFTVAALAQNHDWMDSASTFNRYFIRNKASPPFLGATIPQKQTYFCVKLPGGWWALGLDFALTHDIDRDQFEQFAKLVSAHGLTAVSGGVETTFRIAPTDRIIMVYPEPYWTRGIGDGATPAWPKRYQRLEALFGAQVALRLAGDLHHYMRWTSDSPRGGRLVTCGSGGAFAHPTHTHTTTRPIVMKAPNNAECLPTDPLPDAVMVGHDDNGPAPTMARYRRENTEYPSSALSRKMALDNITALFKVNAIGWGGNWLFAVLLGALYWFNAYLNSVPFIESFKPDGFKPMWQFAASGYFEAMLLWFKAMIFSPLGFVVNVVMATACMVIGREAVEELSPESGSVWRWCITWGFGLAHAFAHVIAVFSLEFWLQQAVGALPVIGQPDGALASIGHALAVGVALFACGALVGGFLFGLYFACMSQLGFLTNNGYSALGIEDFKGFLRFKVGADGKLDAFYVAIDTVPKRWQPSPPGSTHVWDPVTPLKARIHDRFSV